MSEALPLKEDIYAPTPFLGDYIQLIGTIQIFDGQIMRMGTLPTLEEHYNNAEKAREKIYALHPDKKEGNLQRDLKYKKGLEDILTHHKEKVDLLNKLISILNTSEDPFQCMMVQNKILQLVHGKGAQLMYEEPEVNPDLLSI
jgi:hypothetical protein